MRHHKRTDRYAAKQFTSNVILPPPDVMPPIEVKSLEHMRGRMLAAQVPSKTLAVGARAYAGIVKLGYAYGLSTHSNNAFAATRKHRTGPVISAHAYAAECARYKADRDVAAAERAKRARA